MFMTVSLLVRTQDGKPLRAIWSSRIRVPYEASLSSLSDIAEEEVVKNVYPDLLDSIKRHTIIKWTVTGWC